MINISLQNLKYKQLCTTKFYILQTTYSYKSDYDLLFIMKDEKTAKNTAFMKSIKNRIKENCDIDTRTSFIFHTALHIIHNIRIKR